LTGVLPIQINAGLDFGRSCDGRSELEKRGDNCNDLPASDVTKERFHRHWSLPRLKISYGNAPEKVFRFV
jgi:hypothetical protein